MDPKENSYLNNESEEDRAESRPMVDSPFPKLHTKQEVTIAMYSSITPIEEKEEDEKDSSTSQSRNLTPIRHFETQQEQPKGLSTPVSSVAHFKNEENFFNSHQDLISRSAQRVRIYENGEQEFDTTWTEMKKRILDRINGKTSTPTQTSVNLTRLTMSESRNALRRSKRLADIKSKTGEKRKVKDEVKRIHKKVKK